MLRYHRIPLFHCHSSPTLSVTARTTVWKRWKCLSTAVKKKKIHDYTVMPVKYTNPYNSLTPHCGMGKYLLKYLLLKGSNIWWQSSQESDIFFQVLRTLIPVSQRSLKQLNKLLRVSLMDVFISDVKKKTRERNKAGDLLHTVAVCLCTVALKHCI